MRWGILVLIVGTDLKRFTPQSFGSMFHCTILSQLKMQVRGGGASFFGKV